MMEAALSGVHPEDLFTSYASGFRLKMVPVELHDDSI
jgi:hypothetical protein